MALPELLDQCPISPECTSRKLYRDQGDGKIYYVDSHNDFKVHICTTKGSEEPKYAYMGIWYNLNTKRIRFMGPVRQWKSAIKPPNDEGNYRRGVDRRRNWVLQKVKRSNLIWEDVTEEIKGVMDPEDLNLFSENRTDPPAKTIRASKPKTTP